MLQLLLNNGILDDLEYFFTCVQVFFLDFPASLFTGQICQASVELVNAGHRPLHNVIVATSNPEFLTFGSSSRKPETSEKQSDDVGYSSDVVRRHDVTLVTKLDVTSPLDPGASMVIPMWIRSPDVPGDHVIDFLFYYEPTETVPHCRLDCVLTLACFHVDCLCRKVNS